MNRFFRRSIGGPFLAVTGLAVSVFISAHAKPESLTTIRVAPRAPVFEEKERQAELAGRRARVAKSIGPKALLILFSAEPRVYTNDVSYPFRQENNLYYLTGLKQEGATLVLLPENPRLPEILFLPRRNAAAETWTGHMYSAEEAARASGIKEIWSASEFEPFIRALRNRQPYLPKPENILMSSSPPPPTGDPTGFENLFTAAGTNQAELYLLLPRETESKEFRQEQRFAGDWAKSASGYSVRSAFPIFAEMRLRKSPMELAFMQHAIDISTEAHERAWAFSGKANWEYEVDAQVTHTYKLRNADNWGYPDIVGCAANATTLHYEESQGPCKAGDLLLMDVGAEYEHYSADVTRTTPISGKFTPAQADIYQIVYDAQEAGAKAIKPGARVSDVHRAASRVIRDGLLKLGLITDRDSNQYRVWFMHGTSHFLGMNVHDVNTGDPPLEPGMVFTNEPGIYIRPDALDYLPNGWKAEDWEKFKVAVRPAFEKYKGIGVRIEDDMLVTPEGTRWLSGALPRKLSEVEEFIKKARAEMR